MTCAKVIDINVVITQLNLDCSILYSNTVLLYFWTQSETMELDHSILDLDLHCFWIWTGCGSGFACVQEPFGGEIKLGPNQLEVRGPQSLLSLVWRNQNSVSGHDWAGLENR